MKSNNKSREDLIIDTKKKYLLLGSVILTLLTAFIGASVNEEGGKIYGFPVDVLENYGGWTNSYYVWGFLFNVLFYYLILLILVKVVKRLKKIIN